VPKEIDDGGFTVIWEDSPPDVRTLSLGELDLIEPHFPEILKLMLEAKAMEE
jgi:hypothetical protein